MSEELQEAPRPEPDFRVIVERPNQRIDVTHAVQDVYDIAINSMDFGSGFLSTEEVGNLRELGNAIGAQRFDYQHDKCLRCGHDHKRHDVSMSPKCWGEPTAPYSGCTCSGFVRPIGHDA